MEEKVLIEGCISQKAKNIFKGIIIALLIIAIIFIIVHYIDVKNAAFDRCFNYHHSQYYDNYMCYRCYEYLGSYDKAVDHFFQEHSISYFYHVVYFVFGCVFLLFAIIFSLIYLSVSRSNIIITNENISGRTFWGKKVVLPIHMVSSYSISKFFSVIAVSSASGFVKFPFIKNYEEIGSVLQKLLNERQKNTETNKSLFINKNNSNNLDDLKKLKELLDNGIISQEEFETKKKQLLGI